MKRIICQVLAKPGKIVSFSGLNKCMFFRKTIEQLNGKRLMKQVANEIDNLQLGEIHRFTIAGNSCQVNPTSPFTRS